MVIQANGKEFIWHMHCCLISQIIWIFFGWKSITIEYIFLNIQYVPLSLYWHAFFFIKEHWYEQCAIMKMKHECIEADSYLKYNIRSHTNIICMQINRILINLLLQTNQLSWNLCQSYYCIVYICSSSIMDRE